MNKNKLENIIPQVFYIENVYVYAKIHVFIKTKKYFMSFENEHPFIFIQRIYPYTFI